MSKESFQLPIIVVWIACIAYGLFDLNQYQFKAGSDVAVSDWPASTKLQRSTSLPTEILFLHPACPCSAASLDALQKIMSRCSRPAHVIVAFVKEDGIVTEDTNLWQSAQKIPGIQILQVETTEPKLFGATTSGFLALYSPSGNLMFCGGITSERAHIGDSVGADAVVTCIDGSKPSIAKTPAFGCEL